MSGISEAPQRNFAGCWTSTSRQGARWAVCAGVAVVPTLLQTWTPRPCALGLLPRGTRSAIADVSLLQWWRRSALLGISQRQLGTLRPCRALASGGGATVEDPEGFKN